MFKSKDDVSTDFDTLIGSGTLFHGSIESEGTVRIDGKIIGDITAAGNVCIGKNAIVKGNIKARDVQISGVVEGNINADGILRMFSTAKLYGDIEVRSFVADEGGVFQGRCNMVEAPSSLSEDEKSRLIQSSIFKKESVLTNNDIVK